MIICHVLFCVDYLWVSIGYKSFSHPDFKFGCFYCPPNLPSQSVHDLCDNIESMIISKKCVIACGDFNIDMADVRKFHSKVLHDFLTSHSL